jgi:hypothetical protein
MSDHPFLASGDGHYVLQVPDYGLTFAVDRLRRERHELVAELTVKAPDLAGARTVNGGTLSAADFNLSSARARQDRARLLADRSQAPDLDWLGLVEELCLLVIGAERTGQGAVNLADVPCADRTARDWVVGGFHLPRHHPAILFGDGGALKSYVGLWILGDLSRRFGLRVGLFDWELDAEDHRARLGELFDDPLPPVTYVRCERALVAEADRLRRIAREAGLDYAAFDSVAFATDGPPEGAEQAAGYFRAVRQIGVGSLHLAHTTKAGDDNDKRPFGSTFWFNGARAVWFVKRSETGPVTADVDLGLFPRKANLGPLRPPFGLRATFADSRTTIAAASIADVEDLAPRLSAWQRVRDHLKRGPATIHAIAAALDLPPKTVEKALDRGKGQYFARDAGADGVFQWSNLDRRPA